MVRIGMTVRLLAVSALLTGVAFAGNAVAAPSEAASKLADAAATSAATAAAEVSPCARKVKVVYAGYGEAERAGCNATIATTN